MNSMKKTGFGIALIIILTASCKKSWHCSCTMGGSTLVINKAYKAEAASDCAAWQVKVQDTIQQATCHI
jgi:hypothetical protein